MDIDIDVILKKMKIVVIVPTYNNEKTLKTVINDILAVTSNIIIVNDGSTDSTQSILSEFTDICVINYSYNRGKGYALKCGIKKAIDLGYEYALTIDSDGQHKTSSIKDFLMLISKNPDSLIIGSRQMDASGMPRSNSFANKFSNFWFSLQTGISLSDTQSGFRLYPLKKLSKMTIYSNRYEAELEILVRMAWKNVRIISLPIDVYYAPADERVTHFRPFIDFMRISLLNTILTFLAIVYFRPKSFIMKIFR
jgi:glycosyltransferase involved in cell wall biosynthesis